MSLEKYNEKRKFDQTPEPKGKEKKSKGNLSFVIQRHSASHLHYDFRLEMDGVLKSWAIPKGASLDPSDKRLAMMTEDHPISYRDFEGTIPEGNYGGGEVEIWDSGTYQPLESVKSKSDDLLMQEELSKGSLKFFLHGQKLKGEFALVKIKNPKQKNAWLLIKHRDQFAQENYDAGEHLTKNSKVTAREENRADESKSIKKENSKKTVETEATTLKTDKKIKNAVKPMMAKTADQAFNDKDWVFETKWDGYRAIADLRKESVKLYSRNGLSFSEKFSKVVQDLKSQKDKMILDGEVVAFNKKGKPDFQALQRISENPDLNLTFQVFDLLWLNGESTEKLPLLERKKLLKKVLVETDIIKYCEHTSEKGIKYFEKMKKGKLEGMLAKKADSIYSEGSRSKNWLKVKFQNTEDVLICGYTTPKGSRKNFGAIILGTYIEGKLEYCGHAGTGFSNSKLETLMQTFKPLIINKCPFGEIPKATSDPVWLKPELVCEIKFTERTQDGIFRHPVFMGLRTDKEKIDVKKQSKEEESPVVKESSVPTQNEVKKKVGKKNEDDNVKIGLNTVKLTHQNKIYFPESGITKGEVIDYYQSVAEFILPHLKSRPQSLHRFPNGIDAQGFYHKDAGKDSPEWIKKVAVHSDSTDKEIQYLLCNKAEDLAYINNLGCIEINPWNSTVKHLEQPDWLALDLDPSKNNSFDHVIEVALAVKDILDQLKIKGYCKTSGSSGIHIFLPLGGKYEFEMVKDFAHNLMKKVTVLLPKLTTLERNLKKRGNEKIYLDYLQNSPGQTLASVYSIRPKPSAPVSMPLLWEEVKFGLKPDDFNIYNSLKRIQNKGDLFRSVLGKGISLEKVLKNLGDI